MFRVHTSTEMNLNSIIKKNKCGFISSSCTPKIHSCFMVCVIEISYADVHAGVLLSFVLMTKIIGHNRCVYNNYFKVKAKAVSLHAMQAQRGGRSIALPILDPGCFMPRKVTQYPLHGRMGGASGVIWMRPKNLAPTRIQMLDYPVHSELLY